jgi:hypothetical protein
LIVHHHHHENPPPHTFQVKYCCFVSVIYQGIFVVCRYVLLIYTEGNKTLRFLLWRR